jgi:hypothetical protein
VVGLGLGEFLYLRFKTLERRVRIQVIRVLEGKYLFSVSREVKNLRLNLSTSCEQ